MTPDLAQVAAAIAAFAFLLMLLNQGGAFLDRFKEKPPPSETYVTKEGCIKEHSHMVARININAADIRSLRSDIDLLGKELDRTNEARASRMHQRMDAMRETLSDKITGVHKRMDDMPAQMIVLLKNTGAIK